MEAQTRNVMLGAGVLLLAASGYFAYRKYQTDKLLVGMAAVQSVLNAEAKVLPALQVGTSMPNAASVAAFNAKV